MFIFNSPEKILSPFYVETLVSHCSTTVSIVSVDSTSSPTASASMTTTVNDDPGVLHLTKIKDQVQRDDIIGPSIRLLGDEVTWIFPTFGRRGFGPFRGFVDLSG